MTHRAGTRDALVHRFVHPRRIFVVCEIMWEKRDPPYFHRSPDHLASTGQCIGLHRDRGMQETR